MSTETHAAVARLLSSNSQWAADVHKSLPTFFKDSGKGQAPKILWIGCADSRVPESVVTASKPGDIFVHRNIANQFHLDDDNAMSILAFAVDQVQVEHVFIVGHSECGGAAASYNAVKSGVAPSSTTPLGRWLSPLIKLAESLGISEKPISEALPAIVVANVKRQVENVCKAPTITNAWSQKKNVWVHGLVYDLHTGRLDDLQVSRGP